MKKRKYQKGFTLMEVLLASFIIGLMIVVILSLQTTLVSISREHYYTSIAYIRAYSMLEWLRVNHSLQARGRALDVWNRENKILLPQGQGHYTCSNHHCQVQLSWYDQKQEQIHLKAIIW